MSTEPQPAPRAELMLSQYRPQWEIVNQEHVPLRAAFPAVDAHCHLGRWLSDWVDREGDWLVGDIDCWLEATTALNIRAFVNFDGRWGDELQENLDRFDRAHPGRFATLCHADWSLLQTVNGAEAIVTQLTESAHSGAAGVKVWKDLGLHIRDASDELVLPDDPRLFDFWEAAGELSLPVWWHVADPVAFFKPVNGANEAYEVLNSRPEWSVHGDRFPSLERLIASLEEVVSAHPATTFVAVHGGCYAENLGWVDRMLTRYGNLHIDIAARLAQLGRQPRATRELILRHPARVMFGTDEIPPTPANYTTDEQYARRYQRYFRFLESADEWFPHTDEEPPLLGRWSISGLSLPDDVLRAVYSENALRLLPQIASSVTT